MDLREYFKDDEEVLRTVFAGMMKGYMFAMPASVTEDTKDGHVCSVQPTVKRQITDSKTGEITYEDHPVHPDVPIHHIGGGAGSDSAQSNSSVVITTPTKKGDEGFVVYCSRNIDAWHQSGQTQQPIDDRMHHLADAIFIPGVRSTPRKIENVSQTSTQIRSNDGKQTIDHHPTTGTKIKSVDPSDTSDNPFANAKKFYETLVHPTDGMTHNAVDGDTKHTIGLSHAAGALISIANGVHSLLAHPTNGVKLTSSVAIEHDTPNFTFSAGTGGNLT